MKRRSVQHAYENIRPDEGAKQRMLNNILLSSEISPAGKDEVRMRRKMKPMVLVAIIVAMVMLMGCAVVLYRLQDMKIGEFTYHEDPYVDDFGNTVEPTEIVRDVISLQGVANSPGMLAAKEWLEFEESYPVDGQLIGDAEAAGYVAPREYDAYFVYDQTMQDKVDEIAEKYGLKLAGWEAVTQEYQSGIFFDALGMEDLHHEGYGVSFEYLSGYFYECGNFDLSFTANFSEEVSNWQHEVLLSMRYCDKQYLDTVYFMVNGMDDIQQWEYTTADGSDILIVMGDDFARYFCDREDAFITVSYGTDNWLEEESTERMTKADVEFLADCIDFAVVPQKPDMDAVAEAIEKAEQERQAASGKKYYYDYDNFIQNRIESLGSRAGDLYFYLTDLGVDDSGEELILGSKDEIEIVWTIIDGQMNMIMDYGENFQKLEEAWPDMDKKPITEYFSDPAKRDKYGYQRYVMEVLSMEHPENTLFVLSDINDDGTLELLIGDEEILSYVYQVSYSKSGYPNIGILSYSFTEEEWNELREAWPTMDRKPITEYFSE